MREVSLSRVQPEMRLAKPAYNFQGVLLLKPGTKLSGRNIRLLKSWGVTRVWVEGDREDERKETPPSEDEVKKHIRERVSARFSNLPENEVTAEIMKAAVRLLEKRYLEGGTSEENSSEEAPPTPETGGDQP